MKPFNLQDALAGKPVVTRDGRPVTHLTHFPVIFKNDYSIAGVVDGELFTWTDQGSFWSGYVGELNIDMSDLFMQD